MDRLTRDRKNNLQLSGNASISMLRLEKGWKTSYISLNIYYYIFTFFSIILQSFKQYQDIFHELRNLEFRRERERENPCFNLI